MLMVTARRAGDRLGSFLPPDHYQLALPSFAMAPAAPAPNVSQSMVSHDLMTVAAYADTLDALPLDLTRGFSDLRELDAVLSGSSFGLRPKGRLY
jgi:hypothetical protein